MGRLNVHYAGRPAIDYLRDDAPGTWMQVSDVWNEASRDFLAFRHFVKRPLARRDFVPAGPSSRHQFNKNGTDCLR